MHNSFDAESRTSFYFMLWSLPCNKPKHRTYISIHISSNTGWPSGLLQKQHWKLKGWSFGFITCIYFLKWTFCKWPPCCWNIPLFRSNTFPNMTGLIYPNLFFSSSEDMGLDCRLLSSPISEEKIVWRTCRRHWGHSTSSNLEITRLKKCWRTWFCLPKCCGNQRQLVMEQHDQLTILRQKYHDLKTLSGPQGLATCHPSIFTLEIGKERSLQRKTQIIRNA